MKVEEVDFAKYQDPKFRAAAKLLHALKHSWVRAAFHKQSFNHPERFVRTGQGLYRLKADA